MKDFSSCVGEALNAALEAILRCGVVLMIVGFAAWLVWVLISNDCMKNQDKKNRDFHEDDY